MAAGDGHYNGCAAPDGMCTCPDFCESAIQYGTVLSKCERVMGHRGPHKSAAIGTYFSGFTWTRGEL